MAAIAGRYLIKLYELAHLSSYKRRTLHQHDPEQLPLRQSLPGEDPPKKIHTRLHLEKGLADQSNTPRGSLQFDITLRVHERIGKSSPSLTPTLT